MEKPLISFILTYYNFPVKMLCECIDSILALSLKPNEREIIVVDDGSETSPINEIQQYSNNIIYIRQRNGGVSTARNLALHTANGEYIQFIDADDTLVKKPYEHCIDIIRYSNADMVMFDFCYLPESHSEFHDKGPISGTELMRNHNIHGSAWGYLFKQSIRSNLLFTPGIEYGEDEEFTAQLVLRSEALYTTTAKAYLYRQHQDSITKKQDLKSIIMRLSNTKTVILRLNVLTDLMPTPDKKALQRRVAQLTMDYLYNIIRLTQSRHYFERKKEELRKNGLFPLPNHNYTAKYTWFRRIINSPSGVSVLMRIIPLINKER